MVYAYVYLEQNCLRTKKQLILYIIVTCRLENISYLTKNVHLAKTTTNFLFFLKQDPTSIYPS